MMQLFPSTTTFCNPVSQPKAWVTSGFDFCIINGFQVSAFPNPKVTDLCTFMAQMDLDIFGGCKSNINQHHMPAESGLWEWFGSKHALCISAAHNLYNTSTYHKQTKKQKKT